MDAVLQFIDCPAYVDQGGESRCALPADVVERYSLGSTDGWVTAVAIVCPLGHHFSALLDSLTRAPCPRPVAATYTNAI
jgi:hypothetical protein